MAVLAVRPLEMFTAIERGRRCRARATHQHESLSEAGGSYVSLEKAVPGLDLFELPSRDPIDPVTEGGGGLIDIMY